MLVAVEFPGYFVVSGNGEIEEVDFVRRDEGRALAVHCVEGPVDFFPVLGVVISQQSKAMVADLVRLRDAGFYVTRQILAEKPDTFRQFRRGEEEFSRRGGGICCSIGSPVSPSAI